MSPDRPGEFVNQPQPGGSDDHERPEQGEMPQCLSLGDLELSQGDPGEQSDPASSCLLGPTSRALI